jgi:hypothetical protein
LSNTALGKEGFKKSKRTVFDKHKKATSEKGGFCFWKNGVLSVASVALTAGGLLSNFSHMISMQDVFDVFPTALSEYSELLWCRGRGFIQTLFSEAEPDRDIWPELDCIGGL